MAKLTTQYRPENELEPIYRRDRDLYERFRTATGNRPAAIFNVANHFDDDMDVRDKHGRRVGANRSGSSGKISGKS